MTLQHTAGQAEFEQAQNIVARHEQGSRVANEESDNGLVQNDIAFAMQTTSRKRERAFQRTEDDEARKANLKGRRSSLKHAFVGQGAANVEEGGDHRGESSAKDDRSAKNVLEDLQEHCMDTCRSLCKLSVASAVARDDADICVGHIIQAVKCEAFQYAGYTMQPSK